MSSKFAFDAQPMTVPIVSNKSTNKNAIKIEKNSNFIGTRQYKEHKEIIAAEEATFESKYNKINKLRSKQEKIKNDIKELEDELKDLQSQNEK